MYTEAISSLDVHLGIYVAPVDYSSIFSDSAIAVDSVLTPGSRLTFSVHGKSPLETCLNAPLQYAFNPDARRIIGHHYVGLYGEIYIIIHTRTPAHMHTATRDLDFSGKILAFK